jgi:hypothetical protein
MCKNNLAGYTLGAVYTLGALCKSAKNLNLAISNALQVTPDFRDFQKSEKGLHLVPNVKEKLEESIC